MVSGGVGQAAIVICQYFGCKVYITVGSDAKRKMLMNKFPGYLDEKCFASSRTIEFENVIKRETKGRGVDMVLNALAEEKLQVSIHQY